MGRSTRVTSKKVSPPSESSNSDDTSSDEDIKLKSHKRPIKKKPSVNLSKLKKNCKPKNSDSSSESDIENYLKPADQIDLNSSFFQSASQSKETSSFEAIEKNIFSGVNRLSDSDSDENEVPQQSQQEVKCTKVNFQQLHDYTKKIEEAKQLVEKYEAKKKRKIGKQGKKPDEDLQISELLALGETKVDLTKLKSVHSSDFESFSDSEKEDWEEVKGNEDGKESIIPKDGVQITLEVPGVVQKKKGIDLVACMKRRLNRIRKENQIYVHKVHLLCWLGHGNYVNRVLNNQELLALALSLIPSQHCYPSNRTDLNYLEQITRWFHEVVQVVDKLYKKEESIEKLLKMQINRKCAFSKKMLAYMFICVLRSLGIQCRLVLSFQVAPLRPPASELHSLSTKSEEEKNKKSSSKGSASVSKAETVKSDKKQKNDPQRKPTDAKEKSKRKPKSREVEASSSSKVPQVDGAVDSDIDSQPSTSKNTKKLNLKKLAQTKKENPCQSKMHTKKVKAPPKSETVANLDRSPNSSNNNKPTKSIPKSNTSTNLAKLKSKQVKSTEGLDIKNRSKLTKGGPSKSSPSLDRSRYFSQGSPRKGLDIRNDIISIMKGRMSHERAAERSKLVKSGRNFRDDDDYDSDYAPKPIKKKKPSSDDEFSKESKVKVKQRVKVRKEGDEDDNKVKKGIDVWVEVFLEAEERWISADVTKGKVHCIKELYSRAIHPVTYIIAWNNDNSLKDITQRYCPNWNTVTRKLRIDKKWWQSTLRPFEGRKTIRDKEEDEELARLQLEKPLPTSIAEYKDHPLYVLKRHLLKFQALYPPQPITLGFVKNEAVYPRDCVHVLHSREVWIKHAKVVRPGEQPYKIVKARPKYDKLSGKVITDKPLELFGKWQVDDYIPPTAENGIVPRNEYGNVDLFKPTMLPKRTVHLQLPGLNKLAKRMNIDCAPAVVGFDFHSGGSHPTFDGFVVCEEHSESLIAAWYMEVEEQEKKEKEKAEKRIYGNWKKLIKGLLIRERLKARYDFGESSQSGKKRKPKGPKLVSKKRRICSDSESDDELN